MPAQPTTDVSHTEVTDHRILRNPSRFTGHSVKSASTELEPFPLTGETKDDVRDLALAYESLVEQGKRDLAGRAERLLAQANQLDPTDAPVATALGYIAQEHGDMRASRQYYEQALRSDSTAEEAANNLAVIEAGEGHLQRAVSLWQAVFNDAPWRSSVGVNLALAFCSATRYRTAQDYLNRVLEFNPDSFAARSLMEHLSAERSECSIQ